MTAMSVRTASLYDQARRGLAEGDAGYWKAAEAMAALQDQGEPQRAIAAELGCSKSLVGYYLQVWAVHRGGQPRPAFSEAMAAIRDRSGDERTIPKTPERRAELAAELLKDKAIFEQPVVRKEVRRHVDREIRQAAREWNQDHDIPTRTEEARDKRRLYPVMNRVFWRDLLWALEKAAKLLNDAAGELERTGLPEEHAGAVIKAARSVGAAADRFGKTATARAVGSAM